MVMEFFVIPCDLFMITMLISFVVGLDERKQLSRKKEFFIGGLTFVFMAVSLMLQHDNLYIGAEFLYVCISIYLRTSSKRVQKFFSLTFLMLIAFMPLNTFIFILNVLGITFADSRSSAIATIAVLADCAVIFWVFRQRKKYGDRMVIHFTPLEYALSILILFLTVFLGEILNPENGHISLSILENATDLFLLVAVTVVVVFNNMVFIFMIWRSKTSEYYKQLNIRNKQYIESELHYFEIYKHAQDDIRKFRHDMKHHIGRMEQLCKYKNYKKLHDYLHDFQDDWETITHLLYQTGDDNVDAILNARGLQFQNKNIQFSLSGAFANKLRLSPFDLCTIFSNAIDNAIEENQRIDSDSQRYISFSIRRNHYYYVVTIENPLNDPTGNSERTKKKDKSNHGFGLYSIREKAEKNGGTITMRQEQDRFILDILLPI